MDISKEIIKELIKSRLKSRSHLASFKRRVGKKYGISCPSNMELLKAYHGLLKKGSIKRCKETEKILITRPVRSLSGIVNLTVLTKPYSCPGKCLYCPIEKGIPKSYLSGEPAVERAKKLNYHPYRQVQKRIEMLKAEGHSTDKIELRVVGATWSHYNRQYQSWFIRKCFEAANNFPYEKNKAVSLKKEQKRNERAKHRIIGISIETRPDFINQKEIKRLRQLGVTMVELGIQSVYDNVLKANLRGHKRKEIVSATRLLKEAGFKVLYQMMPNLAGSNLKKDRKMFEEIFDNDDFQPDLLKIYPCALLKQAPLYKLWQKGKYKPYKEKELIELIKAIKKITPSYIRIQRISRDIPSFFVVSGPAKITNLRQILKEMIKKENWHCQCIRCREIRENYSSQEKTYLFRKDYYASKGKEIFLSFENKKKTKLYSLLRLRITSNNKAIIREIHTYGILVPFSQKTSAPQHQGLGKKLIKQAEEIAKEEFNLNQVKVIAGIGVRQYFRKLGYRLKDTYMVKKIR